MDSAARYGRPRPAGPEDHDADGRDPGREDHHDRVEERMLNSRTSRGGVPGADEPARQLRCGRRRRRHDHEDGRRTDAVDVQHRVGQRPRRPTASGLGGGASWKREAARGAAAAAAAANSIATKSRPLPRNTVAKNRSSRSPTRLRITAMNQRNAIPANGTRTTPTSAILPDFRRGRSPGSPSGCAGRRVVPQEERRGDEEQDEGEPRDPGRSRRPRLPNGAGISSGDKGADPPAGRRGSREGHCRAIATRSRSSGVIRWSTSSASSSRSICTQRTRPVKRAVRRAVVVADRRGAVAADVGGLVGRRRPSARSRSTRPSPTLLAVDVEGDGRRPCRARRRRRRTPSAPGARRPGSASSPSTLKLLRGRTGCSSRPACRPWRRGSSRRRRRPGR